MSKKNLYSNTAFTKDQLPTNRKELFFDILKNHYFQFLKYGLILFAFFVPLIITGFLKDYSYIYSAKNSVSNASTLLIVNIIEIPLILLLSIFASGMGKVLKEYAWMEPVFFKEDFKEGVKENIKPTLTSAIFIVVLNLIFQYIYSFSDNGWISAIPFGFIVVVFFPIILHTIFINFLYTNPYSKNFKLGCYFYFKHIPSTLLLTLLLVLPMGLNLFHFANILTIMTKYLIIAICIIFATPLIILIAQLNEMRIFDLRINNVRFPEMVNKGLYIPENNKDSSKNDTL